MLGACWRTVVVQAQLKGLVSLESQAFYVRDGTAFVEQNRGLFFKVVSVALFDVTSTEMVGFLVLWVQENPLAPNWVWVVFFADERLDLEEGGVHGAHHDAAFNDSLTRVEGSAELVDSEDLLNHSLDVWDSGGSSDNFDVFYQDFLLL